MTPERRFLFRLALALGRTVAEVERMPAREVDEWQRYYALEPFGAWRDNAHAGLIAAQLANVHRKKSARPVTFRDYLLVDKETDRATKTARFFGWLRAVAQRKG